MQSLCYIVFPETDRYQRTFDEEYLYALHQGWRRQDAAKPPVIHKNGDVTLQKPRTSTWTECRLSPAPDCSEPEFPRRECQWLAPRQPAP